MFILEDIDSFLCISDLFNGINHPPYQNYFDDLIPVECDRKCTLVLVCHTSVTVFTAVNGVFLVPALLPRSLLIRIWPSGVFSWISRLLQCDPRWQPAETGVQRLGRREGFLVCSENKHREEVYSLDGAGAVNPGSLRIVSGRVWVLKAKPVKVWDFSSESDLSGVTGNWSCCFLCSRILLQRRF